MNRSRLVIAIIIIGILIGLGIFLNKDSRSTIPEHKIQVVASFYPLAYIAEVVGGERVSVQDLTPEGAEPHDFEPTLRDIAGIGSADLLLYNGAGFEPWVSGWARGSFDRPRVTIDMTSALKERGAVLIKKGDALDPHVWLDPVLYKEEVLIVRDALIELDPLAQTIYEENANSLIERLGLLDAEIRTGLSTCELRDIVVSHEAFEYFARQYNILVTAIAGISPDEEPSPKDLALIVDEARAKGVKYVFFETAVSPRLSQSLARELGGETLVLYTLESLTLSEVQSGEDYIRMMQKNLTNLRKALSCR